MAFDAALHAPGGGLPMEPPQGGRWLSPGRSASAAWLAAGLLVYAAVWLIHLSMNSLSPPIDNIEQLNWVHSLQWGYYKHPPLTTWLIWIPVQALGNTAWASYVAGACCTLSAIGVLWWLLSRLRGRNHAMLAVLAVLCISYYNARLYIYNHDTVLLLVSTASAALCWKAHASRHMRWWTALGIALGLGILTKYQIAVTMVSVFVFWLSQRGWADHRQRRGLLLASLVALLVFIPHVQWLRTHDFGPVVYAFGSSLGVELSPSQRMADTFMWLVDQVCNRALAAWILLAVAVFVGSREPRLSDAERAAIPPPQSDAGRTLILCWALIPLIFMPGMSLLTGAKLQLHWGSPFLLFLVPAILELTGAQVRWSEVPLRRMVQAFVALQAALLLASQYTFTQQHRPASGRHWQNVDSGGLARMIELTAQKTLAGGTICTVSGPAAISGALALQLTSHPLVLIDGRFDVSPWVDAERVRRCGRLELHGGTPTPDGGPLGPSFPDYSWRVLPAEEAAVMDRTGPPTDQRLPRP